MTKICETCKSSQLGLKWNEDKTGIEPMTFCKNLNHRKKHNVASEHKQILIEGELTECEFYKIKPKKENDNANI